MESISYFISTVGNTAYIGVCALAESAKYGGKYIFKYGTTYYLVNADYNPKALEEGVWKEFGLDKINPDDPILGGLPEEEEFELINDEKISLAPNWFLEFNPNYPKKSRPNLHETAHDIVLYLSAINHEILNNYEFKVRMNEIIQSWYYTPDNEVHLRWSELTHHLDSYIDSTQFPEVRDILLRK